MSRPQPYEPSHSTSHSSESSSLTLKMAVLRMQVIVGALIVGVVMMSAVLSLVSNQQKPQEQVVPVWIGYGVWLFSTMLGIVWPMLGIGVARVPDDVTDSIDQATQNVDQPIDLRMRPWIDAWNRNAIVRAAMLEGGAMACLILWLMTADLSLLTLVGASLSLMLITFPTVSRLVRWLEARKDQA